MILTLDFDLFRICLRDFAGYLIRLQKVLLGDSIDGIQRACLELWIGAVGENTDVLFELLDFGLIHSYLSLLRLSVLNDLLQIFVKNLILVSLCFDITLKLFVILSHLHMKFIINDLGLFHQNVHHNIDFLSNLISFLFEKLEHVVTGYKFVLELFDLLVHRD